MAAPSDPVRPAPDGDGSWIRLKVVPGASRTELAGLLGDRYRVRVAAPPEGGKANRAVIDLLAATLGTARRAIQVVQGHAAPQKTVHARGVAPDAVRHALQPAP